MSWHIERLETLRLPAPTAPDHVMRYRRRLKQLGISPCVDNGIRSWRVLWRPFLPVPVPCIRWDGTPGLKYKADHVCTKRFPITVDCSEDQAFRQAALFAAAMYRTRIATVQPLVDWQALARAKGVVLREHFAKPLLNDGTLAAAEALFAAGYSPRQVGEQLGVDRSTASRWRKRLAELAEIERGPTEVGPQGLS